jgi:cytochrome P450
MTAPAMAPADLVDPQRHATGEVHGLWRWMREHSPVHHHRETDLPAFWSLTKYEDVRAVYRDPATFSSARGVLLRPTRHGDDPGGGLTLALTDPPRHKQLRSLVAAWFTERASRGIEDGIRAAVRATLDIAIERGECDFVRDVAGRLSIYVICGLLGVPERDHEKVFTWTNEAYATHTPLAAQHQLMEYFGELMYQRMEEPAEDMISALANGLPAGELLTEREILLNCENLIGATENGRLAIAGGILALLRGPDQLARLRADRALLASAVEEILRWTSSATHSMRSVTRDTRRLGGAVGALGQPRRGRVRRPVPVRHRPRPQPPPGARHRRALLPRRHHGPHPAAGAAHRADRHRGRHGAVRAGRGGALDRRRRAGDPAAADHARA